jgi:tetratricopeptide (TPR) repeat protein
MRGELDWIVMKALEKDRTRRYETANGFARDIQRYLDGDPVEAGPPRASYKLKKFTRKHRAALSTIGAFVLLLVAATTISVALALWANRERRRSEDREQLAIDAVKRFQDAVATEPELKNRPSLEGLRKRLLKEPLEFFRNLRDRLQADRDTRPESLFRLAQASFNLGKLTGAIGDKRDALIAYRESLAISQKLTDANPTVTEFQRGLAACQNNIGILLTDTGKWAEALKAYERALAILQKLADANPTVTEFQRGLARSHHNFGILLRDTGRPAEALKAFKSALAVWQKLAKANPTVSKFKSQLAGSHQGIGLLLSESGQPAQALNSFDSALAIFQKLAREHPESADFASQLGACLNDSAQIDLDAKRIDDARARLRQAVEWQRKALASNSANPTYRKYLDNHLVNMIIAARALGDFPGVSEAEHELAQLRESDPAMAALDARLAGIVKGDQTPKDNSERLQLAQRAYDKALYTTAARLWAEALAADSRLGDDRQAQHRYNAACAAVLAACGQGKDDPPLDDAAKAKLRGQALTWLKAELTAWNGVSTFNDPGSEELVSDMLTHWKADPELASIRDDMMLAKLPDGERTELKRFWDDVDELLTNVAIR